MLHTFKNISKEQGWDYLILTARFLIGFVFLQYGYGKLTGSQFGLSEAEAMTPIEDLHLFRVAWFLFDHEPFKTFIGISQIACGLLLMINRTVLLGAFLYLPIVVNILVIDLTIMPTDLAIGFAWRLSFYILLDLMILWHYKDRLLIAWRAIWQRVGPRFDYPIWVYFTLPLAAVTLSFLGMLPKIMFYLAVDPQSVADGMTRLWKLILVILG